MRIEVVDASKEGGEDEANNNADAKDKLIGLIGREKYDQINAMIEENLAAQSAQKEADGGEDAEVKTKVSSIVSLIPHLFLFLLAKNLGAIVSSIKYY